MLHGQATATTQGLPLENQGPIRRLQPQADADAASITETAPDELTTSRRSVPDRVSVIIPVKNGAELLVGQLEALERQTYTGEWEVLVVDNGSTDDTVDVANRWCDRLSLRIIDASDVPGISHARNQGLRAARGDLIAFCDSDDEADSEWLAGLVAAAQQFDLVQGLLDLVALNEDLGSHRLPLPPRRLMRQGGFLPFASGANFCVWKDVAVGLGGWQTAYAYGSDDVDFSYRLQLAGYTLGFAESAIMHYRLRSTLRSLVRQSYKYGVAQVQIYRDFRDSGMPRSDLVGAARAWGWILSRVLWTFRKQGRREWCNIIARRVGRIVGSCRYRVLYL